jgi:hypothetical protein
MVQLADAHLGTDASVTAHLCRFLARLQQADGGAVDDLDAAAQFADVTHQPGLGSFVEWNQSLVALLRGPLDEAEATLTAASEHSALRYRADAWTSEPFLGQQIVLLFLRGQLHDLEPHLPALVDSPTPGMRETAALAFAEMGRIDDARACIFNNAPLERDYTYTVTLCSRAERIARVAARDLVEGCRAELEPFGGQLGVVTASVSLGAVDYFLGRLAETAGEYQRAAEHFSTAIDVNNRVGAHVFVPWSRARFALAQIALGDRLAEQRLADANEDARRLGVAPVGRDTPN